MPVPPNQTFATAIDIGTLTGYTAYTTTQDPFDGANVVADLYYSYLPVTGDDMLLVYAYGQASPLYRPATTIWSGPLGSETQISQTATSTPMQQDIVTAVVPGQRVFFKFHRSTADVMASVTLTIRISRGQKESIVAGDLYINDSSPTFPGIVMDPTTAIPKRYQLNYPAGEGQQILTNGIVGVMDAFDAEGVVLYDVGPSGFTVRATPTMPDTHYTSGLASNQIDTFWAFRKFGVGNSFAVSIDEDGVVGTPLDLGFTSIEEGTPQADNSALYCLRDPEIKKITVPGGVGSTFLTVDAGFNFAGANILMMTDDTLLVAYEKSGETTYVKRFNLSAVQQGSTITLTGVTFNLLERIFADPEDPDYFWIWWQTATLNKFQRYKVSDGSLSTSLSRMKFVEGISEEGIVLASTIYSGADFSCVPIVLRGFQPTTQTFTIRRQRRFLLPSSPDNKFMQIPTMELLLRTGIGLTPDAWGSDANVPQGANPQVMTRISKDGGKTWSPERWISAGKIGAYLDRVRILRATGNYRNAVFEVTVSDPNDWQFIAAMGTPIEGQS